VVLANFAKVSDNMVDVQQAGWSFIGPEPFSFFVAGVALCPWHEANQKHEMKVELLDADGAAVPNPETGQPLMVSATFEIGRPPGTKPGASMPMPFAFQFGMAEPEAGAQYEIRVSVDGEHRDDWRLPFTVRDAPVQAQAA
jgi:hypothetical protein